MQEVKPAQDFQRSRRDNLTSRWNLPSRNINFTGRDNLLKQISDKLSQDKPLVISACHGLGGVGKTQLVTEFAYRNEKKYERIIWIPSESTDQIESGYLALGQDLGIIPEKTPPAEAIHIVKTWLTSHPRNLIIFDNAPDNKTVEGYELSSGADILITSRNKDWEGGLAVDVFSLDEAVLYFRKIVGERAGDTKEKIEELAEELGRLPLVLAQATAYIRQNQISIQVYIDLYQEKKAYLLSLSVLPESDHHAAVYVTWDITMEIIKKESELALYLLNICSYLHSEKIPVLLLEPLCEDEKYNPERKELFEEAIGYLDAYSMANIDDNGASLSVHRLVQDVTWLKLNEEKKAEYLESVFRICKQILPYDHGLNKIEHIMIARSLLLHLEALLLRIGVDEDKLMTLLERIASIYENLENAQKQKELNERILSIKERHYGQVDREVAVTLNNLAIACGNLGDEKREKELLERALAIFEKNNYMPDYEVAITLGNLGNVYRELGNAQKSQVLLQRAVTISEHIYGDKHPRIVGNLVNLAATYKELGDTQKSSELLERALSIDELYYGEKHYLVAITLNNLGFAYSELGDIHRSKELLERALDIEESYYDKDHYKIAVTLINLSNVYSALGNKEKQRELASRALKIDEAHYGKDHPHVATDLVSLADACGESGDTENEIAFLQRALLIYKKHYGNHHPNVASVLVNLALVYGDQGKIEEENELLVEALQIEENHYGSDHYQVAITLLNLGNNYRQLGDVEKSKELLERALVIKEGYYGKDHYQTLNVLLNLAKVYDELADDDKKLALLERALIIQERHHSADDPQVASILIDIAITQHSKNKIEEAFEAVCRACSVLSNNSKAISSDDYEQDAKEILEIILSSILKKSDFSLIEKMFLRESKNTLLLNFLEDFLVSHEEDNEAYRKMLSVLEFSKQTSDAQAAAQFGLHPSPPQPLKREKLEESQEKLACKK